jgi:ATP-dependent protease Clp ATPase subunit
MAGVEQALDRATDRHRGVVLNPLASSRLTADRKSGELSIENRQIRQYRKSSCLPHHPTDLERFGMVPEVLDRLPVISTLESTLRERLAKSRRFS